MADSEQSPSCALHQQVDLLRAFCGLLGLQADARWLVREFVDEGDTVHAFGLAQAARALEALGLAIDVHQGGLAAARRGPMPAMAQAPDGRLMLLAPTAQGGWLVQAAGDLQPAPADDPLLQSMWSGRWLTAQARAGESTPSYPSAPAGEEAERFGLRWFLRALHPHRGVLVQVLLASMFVQVLALVTPLVFQVVIDKVLTQHTLGTLDVLVVALLAFGVFEAVLGLMRHYLASHTAHRLDVLFGARVFSHLMRLPLAYFERQRSGDTVARLRELENVRAFITGPGLSSGLDLLFVFVFLAVMAQYSLALTVVVVAALPVFLLISWGLTPLLRRELDDKYALGAQNQSFVVETVSAMETVKSLAAQPLWQREWERRLARHVRSAFHAGQTAQWTQQAMGLASRGLTVLLLWLGARLVLAGDLTVGGLIAFNMLAGRVHAPILKLASLWQEAMQVRVSLRRLALVMEAPPEPSFGAGRSSPPPLRGEVRFEQVGFRYAPQLPPVLHEASLQAWPGEIIGIAGASGVGKTTLARLLQRLYVPQQGRILIDGIDLGSMDPAWLRQQVAVVGQDAVLFNRSVRENIAIGQPALPLERVMEAAKAAGAHGFIMQLPQGYDTVVGERGARLSGGQRARIAIARAIAGEPAVLVLDEATAWLDDDSERQVQAQLRQWARSRTVFLIAHRPATLRLAGRVLELADGRLCERKLPPGAAASPAQPSGGGHLAEAPITLREQESIHA